ncbi:hypothetical protein E6C60_1350 [Paenibacillus algicola]|uniref:Uncharacterized protein n=1 Tax=Paenibacillus algicola TaxID=2565926 RepID=A0A4P8XHQ8_9BACL|nr:hypothetical protein E6C60_1350 [Paenibacillus algicola]
MKEEVTYKDMVESGRLARHRHVFIWFVFNKSLEWQQRTRSISQQQTRLSRKILDL